MDTRRHVFLSATFLSKQYKSIPVEILSNAIFFFGNKRSLLFPKTREEMLEARNNPAKYLEFDEDYKELILHKEKEGLVFWLNGDYKSASESLEKVIDPVSKENYLPLILDETWWKTEFLPKESKYTPDVNLIISNFTKGEFDYDAVMELIYQSNPTLNPTLYWTES